MNLIEEAKLIFKSDKPEHFTNYTHCEECAEHDETLRNSDIDNIGMDELGNLGWDPMCFCSVEGKKYYMPALIRLCLSTLNSNEPYLEQFLYHLTGNGENNDLFASCTPEQRKFIASFISYLFEKCTKEIEYNYFIDDALKAHEIWSKA